MQTTKTLVPILAVLPLLLAAPASFGQTCASDADCGQGMVCHSETVTKCSGGTARPVDCPPNTECVPTPVDDPTCTASVVSRCAYRWSLPCNADGDCGDGFICQPTVRGTCSASGPGSAGSGSAGTGAAGGGSSSGAAGGSGTSDLPVPPPAATDAGSQPVCTTSTSYPGTCQLKNATCSSDADCPTLWTCVTTTTPTATGAPTAVDAGPVVALPPDSPTATSTATGTSITSKTCRSPSGNTRGDGTGGDGAGGTIGTTTGTAHDGGVGKGPPPPPPAEGPVLALSDGGTDSATLSPAATDAAADGGAGKGTTPPAPTGPNANGADSTSTSTTSKTTSASTGGGCRVASGGLPGSTMVMLGLFVAVAWMARRRQK